MCILDQMKATARHKGRSRTPKRILSSDSSPESPPPKHRSKHSRHIASKLRRESSALDTETSLPHSSKSKHGSRHHRASTRSPSRPKTPPSKPARRDTSPQTSTHSVPRTPDTSPSRSLKRKHSLTPPHSTASSVTLRLESEPLSPYSREASPSYSALPKSCSVSPEEASDSKSISFAKFIFDMGQALKLDLHSDSKYTPEYLADMELPHPPKESLRLPMTPVLKQTFVRNMETPYSITAIPSKLESRYRTVPCKGYEKSQLSHQSLVVESSLKKAHPSKIYASVPPGREGRTMDKFGRRLYQNSMMTNRVLNYSYIFTSYFNHFLKILPSFYPDISTTRLSEFKLILKTLSQLRLFMLQASYDAFELSSRVSAFAVTMRHLAWLRIVDMDPNLQD
uniref:Serine/arginine repetitive matrix protein 1-like n=1 Tax=Geotrypetes seraphini TaxID=260995 RepID=A0A6P8S219_GEOSA|nr:serine/arginine repetitive matrix protein 1-like [Geotrypetes seraphini]